MFDVKKYKIASEIKYTNYSSDEQYKIENALYIE